MTTEDSEYYVYFYDPRFGGSRRAREGRFPMPMTLLFHGNTFAGLGNDSVGPFAVLNGKLKQQSPSGGGDGDTKMTFEKQYASHSVHYSGTLTSHHVPLVAKGTWKFSGWGNEGGTWDMRLQASPLPRLAGGYAKQTASIYGGGTTDDSLGSTLDWCPLEFVASSWEYSKSLVQLCVGNVQRPLNTWNKLDRDSLRQSTSVHVIKRSSTLLQSPSFLYEMHPSHVIHSWVPLSLQNSSGNQKISAALSRSRICETSPSDVVINRVGSFQEMAKDFASMPNIAFYHLPEYTCTQGTRYEVSPFESTVLTIEPALLHGLNCVIGTSGFSGVGGDGNLPELIRHCMNKHLKLGHIASALRVQILADFGVWCALEKYSTGIRAALWRLTRTPCGGYDGVEGTSDSERRPCLLLEEEAEELVTWLDEEEARMVEMCTRGGGKGSPNTSGGGGAVKYVEYCVKEIVNILSQV